jgi:hypothetical protein
VNASASEFWLVAAGFIPHAAASLAGYSGY